MAAAVAAAEEAEEEAAGVVEAAAIAAASFRTGQSLEAGSGVEHDEVRRALRLLPPGDRREYEALGFESSRRIATRMAWHSFADHEHDLPVRRSSRSFDPTARLTYEELGALLGILRGTTTQGPTPSAGGLYPIHCYVLWRLDDRRLDDRRYSVGYYDGVRHRLALLWEWNGLASRLFGEQWSDDCASIVVLVGDWTFITNKYGERGLQFLAVEAGMWLERLLERAHTLGLGACALGELAHPEVEQLLGLNDDTDPLLALAVGPD